MGHRQLRVYMKSYNNVLRIYGMTKVYPREERDNINDQIRRSAVSVPLNIAEGYAKRESQAEFKRFLKMAVGSNTELSVLLDLSKDLGYISEAEYQKESEENTETGKMLTALIRQVGEQSKI